MKFQKPCFVVVGLVLLLLVQSKLYASNLVTVNYPSEINKMVPIVPFVSTLGQNHCRTNTLEHIITKESTSEVTKTDH